jgi:type I restriction enzyme S subunit
MSGQIHANGSHPESWPWVRLGDHVIRVGSGFTPLGGQSVYQSSGVPLIRSQNVLMNQFDREGLAYISAAQEAEMSGSRVQAGDVLLNITGASIGRVCVVPSEICPGNVNQHVCVIRTDGSLIPEFLAYYLATPRFQSFINESQTGATRQALTKGMVEAFDIPLPDIGEQVRVVDGLKAQLAEVAWAREAVEEQVEAVQALLVTSLRSIFEVVEAGEGTECQLGQLLRLRKEVIHPRDKASEKSRFVGLGHIESNTGERIGVIDVDMALLTGRKPRFYAGDIVYGYLRPYLNKVWVAEFDGLCSVDQYVYEVRQDVADANFVAWFMRSAVYLRRAPVDATPGWLPRIRTEEVAGVRMKLPPMEEQLRIVRKIEDTFESHRRLRQALQDKLGAIKALPGRVLAACFGGGAGIGAREGAVGDG